MIRQIIHMKIPSQEADPQISQETEANKFMDSWETNPDLAPILRSVIGLKKHSYDQADVIEGLTDAYQAMADGIHSEVQKGVAEGNAFYPRMNTHPTWYMNGEGQDYVREMQVEVEVEPKYDYELHGMTRARITTDVPDYVKKYKAVRNHAFSALLNEANESDEFSFLISTIANSRDPGMANMFLNTLFARKEHYPNWIIGDSDRILSDIDYRNQQVSDLKDSVKVYGLKRRNLELQKRLRDEKTGMLGALAIAAVAKTRFGRKSAIRRNVIEPLEETAQLPLIEEQLLEKEKAALSITED